MERQCGPWISVEDALPARQEFGLIVRQRDGTLTHAAFCPPAPPARPEPVFWHMREVDAVAWRFFHPKLHST